MTVLKITKICLVNYIEDVRKLSLQIRRRDSLNATQRSILGNQGSKLSKIQSKIQNVSKP